MLPSKALRASSMIPAVALLAGFAVACSEDAQVEPQVDGGALIQEDGGTPGDSGTTDDAGQELDAGLALPDVGGPPDAGVLPLPDAGPDAGPDTGPDAGFVPDSGRGCSVETLSPYFGNLHAHTSNSDGDGTPAEAFDHARNQAELDIMVVTDHLEQLYNLLGQSSGDYEQCRLSADSAYEPGAFVADCGFEYGSGFTLAGSTGHNNVFFSLDLFPAIQLDFHDFYQSLVACTECVSQFNHPGDKPNETWNHFEYDADVDLKLSLYEYKGPGELWTLLFEALDSGWHVAPVYNQDNHGADWGSKDDGRAGYFMSALTREALRDAMLLRRAFMTQDKNASLKLMGDGNCWMGSELSGYSSIVISAEAQDPDPGDGFANIELYGPGETVIASFECQGQINCTGSFPLPVSGPTYVLARATQSDGAILISAPIWVEP